MSKLEPTRTYSNPTATEVLCRLLDERGVEWQAPTSFDGTARYDTVAGGYWFHEFNGKITIHGLDPEQAIAATLGSCNCPNNCTDDERTETCKLDDFADVPFSVDYEIEGYDMDSGRDYATLAKCSACGAYIIVPPEYHHVLTCDGDEVYQPYRFCPNCGRRIEQ